MPQVKVKIHPDGRTEIEGVGFVGKACDRVIDPLVRALGSNPDTLDKQYKPEAYVMEGGTEQIHGG